MGRLAIAALQTAVRILQGIGCALDDSLAPLDEELTRERRSRKDSERLRRSVVRDIERL